MQFLNIALARRDIKNMLHLVFLCTRKEDNRCGEIGAVIVTMKEIC